MRGAPGAQKRWWTLLFGASDLTHVALGTVLANVGMSRTDLDCGLVHSVGSIFHPLLSRLQCDKAMGILR
jgi:hypothetical protein